MKKFFHSKFLVKPNYIFLALFFATFIFVFLPATVFSVSSKQKINIQVNSSVPYNHCVDGVQNYDETGVDCGGAMCASCGGGGGGGGGGGTVLYSSIAFSGQAAPGATVKILRNGILTSTVNANINGDFALTINYLTAGTHTFIIYYEDTSGIKSASITQNITISQNQNITVNNILLPPTLSTNKQQVEQNAWINFFGQSAPNSQITITISPTAGGSDTLLSTLANQLGIYEYYYSAQLPFGGYIVKSKAKLGVLTSDFSLSKNFSVGTSTVEKPHDPRCPQKGDVNYDCRVNLVDFSITAYWFRRTISSEFIVIENDQLSGDSKIDLVDFSILAYYWTG
jgi:hypothetical protein